MIRPGAPWLTDLVSDALTELRIRQDGDRHETAWRTALLFCRQWTFDSSYEHAAWMALALALNDGDAEKAEEAALWLARPGEAMALACARLARSTGCAAVQS